LYFSYILHEISKFGESVSTSLTSGQIVVVFKGSYNMVTIKSLLHLYHKDEAKYRCV